MDEAISEFLFWAQAEVSLAANTRAAYERDLARYRAFLKESKAAWKRVRPEHVLAFLAAERRAGRSESTLSRRFACLRSFHRFCIAEGLLDRDPCETLDSPRRWRTLPRVPSRRDVETVLESIPLDTARGRRDKAMLEMLYATGARVSELVNATDLDYKADLRLLRLRGKGNKERVVPVGRSAHEALARHHEDREVSGHDPLVSSMRGRRLTRDRVLRVLREYSDAAGVKSLPSPHAFRHAFATHLLEGSANIRAVQELLGHASVTTTQIYTHVEQDRLRAIHKKFHPRA
ncbi:MAG: tyrosine recombinase [Planctomycetota bacterium]